MANADPRRIDVHHHIAPPGYIADLDPKGVRLTRETRNWSPAQSIELMDQGGVEIALTSITTPGLWFGDAVESRKLARLCNDYAAKLRSDHPKRFGMFVNLPMPDIDGSLREIEYGLDVLKADGIVFFTSYRNTWLGDPAFDPVFEELNRRKAAIYVHPCTPACCENIMSLNESMIEYGTDTTRAIAQMTYSGRSARFSDIRLIWSHGGGTMPFLIARMTGMARAPHYASAMPQGFLHEARRFFYDTAAVFAAGPMLALRQVVPVDNIVFGTDVPWGNPAHIANELAVCGVFDEAELRKIDRDNALGLFPQYE
ncbi:MAG TPA: amidohydrolase family protein [Stellaceae bacterium]|nr:amidohydrolase family protein [Stellaceae bacterium]